MALNIWSEQGMREWYLYFMVDRRERGRGTKQGRGRGKEGMGKEKVEMGWDGRTDGEEKKEI